MSWKQTTILMYCNTSNPIRRGQALTCRLPGRVLLLQAQQLPTISPTFLPVHFPSLSTTFSNTLPRTSRKTLAQMIRPVISPQHTIHTTTRTIWEHNTRHHHPLLPQQTTFSSQPQPQPLVRRKRRRKPTRKRNQGRNQEKFESQQRWTEAHCIVVQSVKWRIQTKAYWNNICWVTLWNDVSFVTFAERV
uniref:Uncharacterized protein n=1 Tax=Cacopsylla melanoneura TaxID=428564 RepID=A0A8D9B5X8_9HEMI